MVFKGMVIDASVYRIFLRPTLTPPTFLLSEDCIFTLELTMKPTQNSAKNTAVLSVDTSSQVTLQLSYQAALYQKHMHFKLHKASSINLVLCPPSMQGLPFLFKFVTCSFDIVNILLCGV